MIEPYLTLDMIERLKRMSPAQQKIALVKIGQEEFARCSEDLMYWLDKSRHPIPYAYTKDPKAMHQCTLCGDNEAHHFDKRALHLLIHHKIEAHKESDLKRYFAEMPTVRPFPILPYVEPIMNTFQTEKLVALEKSRDMLGTWSVIAFLTWDGLFHKGRQILYQSEDATRTRDLIDRSMTMWKNQPEWLRNVHKATVAEGSNKAGIIKIPTLQSEILGLPKGSTKVRQYHPSAMFSDEAAFNPEASESFSAIKPAISAGGRYIAISSANPSWFMHICRDSLGSI